MTITLGIGWWAVPAAVTLIAFAWSSIVCAKLEPRGGSYGFDATPIVWLFFHGAAAVVALVAWLIWAVLT